MAGRLSLLIASAAVGAALCGPAAAHGAPPPRPPGSPDYIERTEWVYHGERATLRIYPTAWGWAAAGIFTDGAQSYDAWAELLEHAPDANTLSMQNQFMCYWQLATFTNPGKVGTWNLEPWRPVVSSIIMQNSGCNPGGPDDVLNW